MLSTASVVTADGKVVSTVSCSCKAVGREMAEGLFYCLIGTFNCGHKGIFNY